MIKQILMQMFRRDHLMIEGIIEIIRWPSKGYIDFEDPKTNLYLGMIGTEVQQQLKNFIAREEKNSLQGIDNIISVTSWPQIWRFIIKENKLSSIIVEYGIYAHFEKIFPKVESRIKEIFANSIETQIDDSYFWEYNKLCCCLFVLLDKIAYLRPHAFMRYIDIDELEATFIRKPKTKNASLPTIAIIFSIDHTMRNLSVRYLHHSLLDRSKTTTFYYNPF